MESEVKVNRRFSGSRSQRSRSTGGSQGHGVRGQGQQDKTSAQSKIHPHFLFSGRDCYKNNVRFFSHRTKEVHNASISTWAMLQVDVGRGHLTSEKNAFISSTKSCTLVHFGVRRWLLQRCKMYCDVYYIICGKKCQQSYRGGCASCLK